MICMKLFLTSRKRGEIEKRPSLANLTCRSPSVHTKPEVQGKDKDEDKLSLSIHAILHVASPHFPHLQKCLKHLTGTQCGLIS